MGFAFDIRIGEVDVQVMVPRPVAKHEWQMGDFVDSGAVRAQAISRVTRLLGEHHARPGDTWRVAFYRDEPPKIELVRRSR